jgi:catechol 2,3-dioxygenase-like lactoylglutathione lyase family enzyme
MMQQRLSLVTLGVADLARAVDFYENVLGWKAAASPPEVAFFDLNGVVFSLFPHTELAKDSKTTLPAADIGSRTYEGFTLAHNVASKAEVDAIFARLQARGVTIVKPPEDAFWGGYSGYFADPDGHLWEIAYNPFWTIHKDGRIAMTKDA